VRALFRGRLQLQFFNRASGLKILQKL